MRLKEIREKSGFLQKDVAEKLNITATTLSKYENGTIEPNIEMLVKMAKFFGVSVDYIVGADTTMLDLKRLDDNQKTLIEECLKLNPRETDKVIGFIKGMKS